MANVYQRRKAARKASASAHAAKRRAVFPKASTAAIFRIGDCVYIGDRFKKRGIVAAVDAETGKVGIRFADGSIVEHDHRKVNFE